MEQVKSEHREVSENALLRIYDKFRYGTIDFRLLETDFSELPSCILNWINDN